MFKLKAHTERLYKTVSKKHGLYENSQTKGMGIFIIIPNTAMSGRNLIDEKINTPALSAETVLELFFSVVLFFVCRLSYIHLISIG